MFHVLGQWREKKNQISHFLPFKGHHNDNHIPVLFFFLLLCHIYLAGEEITSTS